MLPPASTVALNPYTRPQTPVHAGEIPRGAQLLTTVRKSPGGGRDLYASPDGQVYQRKPDGWYRRQSSGGWAFAAPAQGQIERNSVATARGGAAATADAGYRVTPGAPNAARRDRVPDSGSRVSEQQVADLEREHYARTLSQYRAQNTRPAPAPAPRRSVGRRR
jgi:hypothetical protein